MNCGFVQHTKICFLNQVQSLALHWYYFLVFKWVNKQVLCFTFTQFILWLKHYHEINIVPRDVLWILTWLWIRQQQQQKVTSTTPFSFLPFILLFPFSLFPKLAVFWLLALCKMLYTFQLNKRPESWIADIIF